MISMELTDEKLTEIRYVQISQYLKKVMKTLDGGAIAPTIALIMDPIIVGLVNISVNMLFILIKKLKVNLYTYQY